MAPTAKLCEADLNVKPCKRCKMVAQSGLKCVRCDTLCHNSCVKHLKNIVTIDSERIICCEVSQQQSGLEDDAFFDAIGNLAEAGKIDINIFNYVIKLKDQIISELQEKNSLLNNQIELISQSNIAKSMSTAVQKADKNRNSAGVKTDKTDKQVKGPHQKQKDNIHGTSEITKSDVAVGIMQTESEIKLNKYIHINNDVQKTSTTNTVNEWQKVEKKKGSRRQVIIGSNRENKIIQGVPRGTVLHVYRLDKNTTVDSLKEHVKQHFPEVEVEAMTSRHPHLYASFKVTILDEHFGKAMDPEMWPHGACVSRFLFLREKKVLQT